MMYSWVEINLAKQEYKDVLPKWLLDEPDRFIRLFDRLTAFEHAQTGPRCLVHGDSHQGNSYVRPNGERVWLDWQLVQIGSASCRERVCPSVSISVVAVSLPKHKNPTNET